MIVWFGFQCNLKVVPKARKEEPRFIEKLLSVKIMEGETIALKVRAAGEPIPKLTWLKVRVLKVP